MLDGPLQEIIECSREAATPLDYHQTISTWVSKLTPAAAKFGLKGPNFMHNVEAGLEKMMREQADMQAAANAKDPRDVDGGMFHGGIRGRVQEAQHQIKRAKAALEELKKWEAQEARRLAAKAAAKN